MARADPVVLGWTCGRVYLGKKEKKTIQISYRFAVVCMDNRYHSRPMIPACVCCQQLCFFFLPRYQGVEVIWYQAWYVSLEKKNSASCTFMRTFVCAQLHVPGTSKLKIKCLPSLVLHCVFFSSPSSSSEHKCSIKHSGYASRFCLAV